MEYGSITEHSQVYKHFEQTSEWYWIIICRSKLVKMFIYKEKSKKTFKTSKFLNVLKVYVIENLKVTKKVCI